RRGCLRLREKRRLACAASPPLPRAFRAREQNRQQACALAVVRGVLSRRRFDYRKRAAAFGTNRVGRALMATRRRQRRNPIQRMKLEPPRYVPDSTAWHREDGTRAIPEGETELRGGRERAERRGAAPARGHGAHGTRR